MGRAKDRLGRVGTKLRTLPDEGVQSGSKIIKASVDRALRQDAGSDRRLSGIVNGRPQTINVTKRTVGNLVVGRVMAGPRTQRAPWFWMQEGTDPHPTRISRDPDGRRVHGGEHPGTPPKRTWSRGVGDVEQQVRDEFERLWRRALEG